MTATTPHAAAGRGAGLSASVPWFSAMHHPSRQRDLAVAAGPRGTARLAVASEARQRESSCVALPADRECRRHGTRLCPPHAPRKGARHPEATLFTCPLRVRHIRVIRSGTVGGARGGESSAASRGSAADLHDWTQPARSGDNGLEARPGRREPAAQNGARPRGLPGRPPEPRATMGGPDRRRGPRAVRTAAARTLEPTAAPGRSATRGRRFPPGACAVERCGLLEDWLGAQRSRRRRWAG